MMDGASGARKYTSGADHALAQGPDGASILSAAVSAYAAKRNFDVIRAKYPDFVIASRRSIRPTRRIPRRIGKPTSSTNSGPIPEPPKFLRAGDTDRPLHRAGAPHPGLPGLPRVPQHGGGAPRSMVKIYGSRNGFGWKVDEVAAAQVVSVPIQASARTRRPYPPPVRVALRRLPDVMYVAINLLLNFVVVRPIERIAATAEAVSMGDLTRRNMSTPRRTRSVG